MDLIINNYHTNKDITNFIDKFFELTKNKNLIINIDCKINYTSENLEDFIYEINNGLSIPKYKISIMNKFNENDKLTISSEKKKRKIDYQSNIDNLFYNKIYQYYFINYFKFYDNYYKNIFYYKIKTTFNKELFDLILSFI